VSPSDRDSGQPFHFVAGWLARAKGILPRQEEQSQLAVKERAKNDLYQFNLQALQIRSKTRKSKGRSRYALATYHHKRRPKLSRKGLTQ